MIQRISLAGLFLLVCSTGWYVAGETRNAARVDDEAVLMLAKLASSQKIFEGLVSKNFEDIAVGSSELTRICNAKEWDSHMDPIYAHYRKDLVLQAEKMNKAAKERNLDGSTYAYMHALTTCISCHEYCRDVLKIAETEPELQVVPIPVTDREPVIRR